MLNRMSIRRLEKAQIVDCVSKGFLGLQVGKIKISPAPTNFPYAFKSNSDKYVSDGKLKISNKSLFTWGVNTCALLIVWGKSHVIMLHLSGWNADGNPYANECIDISLIIPNNFEFIKAVILPGESIDKELKFMGSSVLKDLMEIKVLKNISWKKDIKILIGLKAKQIINASVQSATLEIFDNPLLRF